MQPAISPRGKRPDRAPRPTGRNRSLYRSSNARPALRSILLQHLVPVRLARGRFVKEGWSARRFACRQQRRCSGRALHQHLSGTSGEPVDLMLYPRIDHRRGTAAVRASQVRCCSEQPTDQGTLFVDLAPVRAEMGTLPLGKCCVMLGLALDGESGHFCRRSSDGSAAVVAPGYALERWNSEPKIADGLIVRRH